ncbi:MAG TPA: 4Fe-4S dicluster domain-containing protein [Acidobacteriota bacterium]|jgi:ferredoxin|nr:4Fe-4S dicluster domain-containing protein [Acidobacteriota bacterium]HNT17885.1 4Fe-4S dicluster domain-containing protein [Acidobacteriota bacterium]HPA27552.1 4Fe-4S dicluster domain-containing protein [Acidobacteriota bacterium]HQO20374.1 4Fe-4S dicluster domain-containing protein [Acidobacteriota bacterium]HQQ47735.1 4Fe-4S dicluster domain-containing protein [Acidobacteriota bacterium]
MISEIKKYCRELLDSKKVDAIIGVSEEEGQWMPFLFTESSQLDKLFVDKKYPLMTTSKPMKENILSYIQRKHPGMKLAIVARGCDERAIFELVKRGQVKLENLEIIGYACDRRQAETCTCPTPHPTKNLKFGEKAEGVKEHKLAAEFDKMSLEEKSRFWHKQFSKCIKCYGCRNACPVCFCKTCLMEAHFYTQPGELPVEYPTFHFVQRYHHAAQCIECGECELACPMDIPLRLMSQPLLRQTKELYDYVPGMDPEQECPLFTIKQERAEEASDELF